MAWLIRLIERLSAHLAQRRHISTLDGAWKGSPAYPLGRVEERLSTGLQRGGLDARKLSLQQQLPGTFSPNVRDMHSLWQQVDILRRLERINPDGPNRIANSPLLMGEYRMYEAILEVTYMHRLAAYERQNPDRVEELISTVKELNRRNRTRFEQTAVPVNTPQGRHAMREICHLIANSLLICLIALREDTEANGRLIDSTASESLERVARFPEVRTCLVGLVWPLEILVCALRRDEDFDFLVDRLSGYSCGLDPGHRRRLEALVDRVRGLRKKSNFQVRSREQPSFVPAALSLLSRPKGILSGTA